MDQTSPSLNLNFSHLPEATKEALELLSHQDWIKNSWYLAGECFWLNSRMTFGASNVISLREVYADEVRESN